MSWGPTSTTVALHDVAVAGHLFVAERLDRAAPLLPRHFLGFARGFAQSERPARDPVWEHVAAQVRATVTQLRELLHAHALPQILQLVLPKHAQSDRGNHGARRLFFQRLDEVSYFWLCDFFFYPVFFQQIAHLLPRFQGRFQHVEFPLFSRVLGVQPLPVELVSVYRRRVAHDPRQQLLARQPQKLLLGLPRIRQCVQSGLLLRG
mmetsp:Transcript_15760/g.39015  ORF Transcript_15760/g.39015 Transcript_15760/m.39015 type:complete len:206 (+) Transcript_15760:602-1219(+)